MPSGTHFSEGTGVGRLSGEEGAGERTLGCHSVERVGRRTVPSKSTTGNLATGRGSKLSGGQGEKEKGRENKSCVSKYRGLGQPHPSLVFQCAWASWSLTLSRMGKIQGNFCPDKQCL